MEKHCSISLSYNRQVKTKKGGGRISNLTSGRGIAYVFGQKKPRAQTHYIRERTRLISGEEDFGEQKRRVEPRRGGSERGRRETKYIHESSDAR